MLTFKLYIYIYIYIYHDWQDGLGVLNSRRVKRNQD